MILAGTSVLAENRLPGEKPCTWQVRSGEGDGKQSQVQGFPKTLVVAPLPELDSEVIYSKEGITFPGMKGFVILVPGTSARIDSEFGLKRSMGPLANMLVDAGYGVLAFRQPIYHMAEDPELRKPYLEKYGKLDGNLDWFLKATEFAQSRLPEGTPLHFMGRSTGTGVALQALHEYANGNPRFDILKHFETMLFMSVDGHTEDAIKEWHEAEIKEFIVEKPETGDPPVVMACPTIFRDMTWQTRMVSAIETLKRKMPKVFMTGGSRDEFTDLSVSLGPAMDFAKNHPGLFIGVLLHDGFHNPNRPIPGVPGAETMSRTKMLTSWPLYPEARRLEPGVHVVFNPTPEAVWSPMSASEQANCRRILGEAGAVLYE